MNEPRYTAGHHLLQDRTAVITAAAGAGIGGATARRFLEEGARIVIGDAHARRLKETEEALTAEFGAAASPPCPATSPTRTRSAPCSHSPNRPTAASTSSSTTPGSAAPRPSST